MEDSAIAFSQGSNAYISVSDLTSMGEGFTVPASWSESEQEDAIIRATQRIDMLTRNHWGSTSLTLDLSGDGDDLLDIRQFTQWPIVSISSILFRAAYDKDFDWAGNGDTIDEDSYVVSRSRHGILRITGDTIRRGGGELPIWIHGHQNYRVAGTFGQNEIPEDLKLACAFLTRELITPGTLNKYEQPIMERFPDGYAVTRRTTSGAVQGDIRQLTRFTVVNDLLIPYVTDTPLIGIIK